ncbi:MAG: aspartate aminotransferase family protein [Mesorhizobium sp.]|uniref:aspartate aminotransferase family protein n=1 Tax=Mesorhizobium sp. TaxID=1871066 RepID=UPI0012027A20|nr:aspartate aminotransferase family protein [Mesorhizobium sp.]TIN32329.1 MAG: aspartate aminotransferase family protein [Mesorhizobium sp.]TJU83536.1 MAG: aspartate aminotransferase family protein [Mesorhizobium sp.]
MSEHPRSAEAFAKARRVMPGGNTRASAFETPHPIYLASGQGAHVTDIDGRRYLDFQNNFTTLIHGHRHPTITAALASQIEKGVSFSNPTLMEIELAELLCDRVPYFDHVRFTNTGSEAVMIAIKAARAITGRQIIAKCEGAYHGNYDFVEMSVGKPPILTWQHLNHGEPSHRGVAANAGADVVIIPFNDVETTKNVLAQVEGCLAAVLVDPLPSRAGLTLIAPDYLRMLRQWTKAQGSLLISDEVLSFRLGYAGALGAGDIFPDLCTFGKIIGGGLPIGAIAGPSEIMAVFDPSRAPAPVTHAGTFTANPLSMVAGTAAISSLREAAFSELAQLGTVARSLLQAAMDDLGIKGTVSGAGSLFKVTLGANTVRCYRDTCVSTADKEMLASMVRGMRNQGVLLSPIGLGALSTVTTREHVDQLASAFRMALACEARIG